MNYDTSLFIEIIESIPGIIFLRSDYSEDVHLRFYQGLKGNLVIIDTSDEDMPNDIGMGYLIQLGLGHLILALFPDNNGESDGMKIPVKKKSK